jgi:3-hydroxyacyl-CoA dehydrogenase
VCIFKAAEIGAGAMGAEIAQVISYSGPPVMLQDVDQAMLDPGPFLRSGSRHSRTDSG